MEKAVEHEKERGQDEAEKSSQGTNFARISKKIPDVGCKFL